MLPAQGIVDRASFFAAVHEVLPLDPPLASARSWDALEDSLWEGLRALPDRRIAIIWPEARALATAAPKEFEIAVSVLAQVAKSLADEKPTNGDPKDVVVLVDCVTPR